MDVRAVYSLEKNSVQQTLLNKYVGDLNFVYSVYTFLLSVKCLSYSVYQFI